MHLKIGVFDAPANGFLATLYCFSNSWITLKCLLAPLVQTFS